MGCIPGKLGFGPGRDVRERRDVDERGNDRHLLLHEPGNVPRQKPRGVFDAVDSGVEHVVQGVFAEAVRGDPGAFIVGGADGVPHRCGGKRRREVTGVAVDPVPHELDPAVTGAGLFPDCLHELLRLDLHGEVAQVAPRPGDVPPGPNDPRRIRRLLQPPGVAGSACVPDQQCAGIAVRHRLGVRNVVVHGTAGSQPDVAVRVHETRQYPAVQHNVRSSSGRAKVSLPSTAQSPCRSWSGPVRTVPLNSMMRAMPPA